MTPQELLSFDELLELWYLTQYNTWAALSQWPTWNMLQPTQQESFRGEFNKVLKGYVLALRKKEAAGAPKE